MEHGVSGIKYMRQIFLFQLMLTKQQLATSTTKTTPYPHVQSRINTVIKVKISDVKILD